MDKILDIYSSVLRGYLSKRFINEPLINSIDLNKERFNVKAVFIASIFFLKHNSSHERSGIVSQTDTWLSSYFSEDNLFSLIINKSSKELIDTVDESLYGIIGIESIHIPSLYENLLGIEAGNENNRTEVSAAKNYRNKLGSYYTPDNLAKAVTQRTIDEFIAINFGGKNIWRSKNPYEDVINEIPSVTFADFSCGGGNFLIEIIRYFERLADHLNLTPDKRERLLVSLAKNISAFDVDCLALEVAKLSVLLRIERPTLYNELSKNFIHGNFLLLSDFPVDETKKLDVFASGFIYHESLSIDKSRIANYDIVLGNPPWEKIRFEEKKFYALFESSIQNNHFKATRKIEIADIKLNNRYLASFSSQYQLEIEKAKRNLKRSSLFGLSNNGELNTYALFTELAMKFRTNRGIAGLVLKSAIATSQINQKLFRHLTREHRLIAIYDFINRKKIFSIDTRERFCFILIGKAKVEGFRFAMNLLEVEDIENPKFNLTLSYKDLQLLNPLTGMLPNFSNKEELEFLMKVSTKFPSFNSVFEKVRFGRIVHFTSHADFISKKKDVDNLPVYEGKFFNQFDGRFSGFNGVEDKFKSAFINKRC